MTTPIFEATVGILVKAWLNGTLLKGDCQACAVGNICAAALGKRIEVRLHDHNNLLHWCRGIAKWDGVHGAANWGELFSTNHGVQETCFEFSCEYHSESQYYKAIKAEYEAGQYEIAATGYSPQQLARVELAFESAAAGYSEEAEFAGLMAVLDVLADIHGIDLTTATAAKALFVKPDAALAAV